MSREIGNAAEDLAVAFLEVNGFKVLDRNYFARVGEIDIIAEKDNVISFVEVKERAYTTFGGASAAITKTKIQKILKTAKRYLYEKKLLDSSYRIDAVLIDGENQPELLENIYTEGMS